MLVKLVGGRPIRMGQFIFSLGALDVRKSRQSAQKKTSRWKQINSYELHNYLFAAENIL